MVAQGISTKEELHTAAIQTRKRALAVSKQCGCARCTGFVDAMSRAGFSPGPGSDGQVTSPGVGSSPLGPGENKNPPEADRDPISGKVNSPGRATIPELVRNCGEVKDLLVPLSSRKR